MSTKATGAVRAPEYADAVKVRAEAIALEEPLAGGVAEASVVVEPLVTGEALWPESFYDHRGRGPIARLRSLGFRSSPDSWTTRPVPAYLVRHPGVGPILVDTGLHPSIARNPRDNLSRLTSRHYRVEEGKDIVSQLRERGVEPADVAVVILTHLHEDHASAISAFPESVFVLSSEEWAAATTGSRPMLRGYHPPHYDFAFDFNTIDFDSDQVESYGPLGRTFDLFHDGSIRLAFTPGHSAGHISVVLALPRRDFVVIGDAAYDWKEFRGQTRSLIRADEHNWQRSLKELQVFRKEYPYALLVPGHDAKFFAKLEPRYEE
jgi:N-acyl homoserine lactone hydrolase